MKATVGNVKNVNKNCIVQLKAVLVVDDDILARTERMDNHCIDRGSQLVRLRRAHGRLNVQHQIAHRPLSAVVCVVILAWSQIDTSMRQKFYYWQPRSCLSAYKQRTMLLDGDVCEVHVRVVHVLHV